MNKVNKAKLILIEIESLQTCENVSNGLALLNEILRDSKELAEEIVKENEDKEAA